MPSKRERGKQRKAGKNQAAINGVDNIPKTVALLRKGDYKTTSLLGDGSLEEFNGISYEQSGILSTVLKFLKRCEYDTFVKVMLDIGGGNLTAPQLWIRILIKAEAQEESCRLQIAQSIGPLVRCMCNDTKRQFFKSNKHWLDTIRAFAALIHNMILSGVSNSDKVECKMIIDTLFQHEGLLTSIVQWVFWDEKYRPDIVKELETDEQVSIVRLGKATVKRLIKAADRNIEESRERLETIGTTPIISKEYDSECTISFVVGLIRQTKIVGWSIEISNTLRRLTSNASCVDKDVITEMIDLGMNTSDDRWAVHIAVLLRFMILKENSNDRLFYSNDTKFAFAIRSSLIELCLAFIERFGLLETFDKKKDNLSSLFFTIKMILTNTYWIALHKKTAKAIRSKRRNIEEKLARLEQNTDITTNPKCKKLLDMARSLLVIHGSYCCRCNKSLSKTEVKLCNDCGCMAYCSRACQKEDWFSGHSQSCCKSYNNEISGQFQGRFHPMIIQENERAAAKMKELEINLSSVQLKIFLGNSETILSQANSLDIPLYDCVVVFDFRACPFSVVVEKYTEEFNTPSLKWGFEDSRSKENITCIFTSYMYDWNLVGKGTPTLQMQRLFPHVLLSKSKEKMKKTKQIHQ